MLCEKKVVDKTCNIEMHGKFTFEDHKIFRDIYSDCEMENINTVEMDFSDVEYIDSAAVGMLLWLNEKISTINGALSFRGLDGQPGMVFRICDLQNKLKAQQAA